MSDQIYSSQSENTNHNIVTVAQACRGVLTKRYQSDGNVIAYDQVKYYNFFEQEIDDLQALYSLSIAMLDKPRCCYLRCIVKDKSKRKHVRRLANSDEATLISGRFNWFAIDVDKFEGKASGNLVSDALTVIYKGLPSRFHDVECFAMATAGYGIKPGIRLRLFYWSDKVVSNKDIHRTLMKSECVDPAIYQNPVQPIYTASPLFAPGVDDPCETNGRIAWIKGSFNTVRIDAETINKSGDKENEYDKDTAMKFADKVYVKVGTLSYGERHNGLIANGIFLGKLVGQGHFTREEVVARLYNCCVLWGGTRDTKKDMETITYAVDHGIDAMGRNDNV